MNPLDLKSKKLKIFTIFGYKMETIIYISIPVFNRIKYTIKCIESIKKQSYRNYKILICDDGSTDRTSQIIREKYPEIILLQGDGNLWWAGGTNKCVKKILEIANNNDLIFTLNNDTELLPDTLKNLYSISKKKPKSIIGAVNVFFEETVKIEPSAFIRKNKFIFRKLYKRVNEWGEKLSDTSKIIEVDALSGKGVLIPVEIYKKIGIYNSEKLPHYHADTEFTLRAKKNGYKIYLSYKAKILSHQNLTGTGTIATNTNIKEFIQSFKNIKSAIHFKSLLNYWKIIYGWKYIFYINLHLIFIIGGFFKRYFKNILNGQK